MLNTPPKSKTRRRAASEKALDPASNKPSPGTPAGQDRIRYCGVARNWTSARLACFAIHGHAHFPDFTGSGEFLLGPATFVKHGLTLLWVTLVAVFFQTIFNTELMRYTLATGEPVSWSFDEDEPKEITIVEKQVDGTRAHHEQLGRDVPGGQHDRHGDRDGSRGGDDGSS